MHAWPSLVELLALAGRGERLAHAGGRVGLEARLLAGVLADRLRVVGHGGVDDRDGGGRLNRLGGVLRRRSGLTLGLLECSGWTLRRIVRLVLEGRLRRLARQRRALAIRLWLPLREPGLLVHHHGPLARLHRARGARRTLLHELRGGHELPGIRLLAGGRSRATIRAERRAHAGGGLELAGVVASQAAGLTLLRLLGRLLRLASEEAKETTHAGFAVVAGSGRGSGGLLGRWEAVAGLSETGDGDTFLAGSGLRVGARLGSGRRRRSTAWAGLRAGADGRSVCLAQLWAGRRRSLLLALGLGLGERLSERLRRRVGLRLGWRLSLSLNLNLRLERRLSARGALRRALELSRR